MRKAFCWMALALAFAALGSSGCKVHHGQNFLVEYNRDISSEGECTIKGGAGGGTITVLFRGVMDLAVTSRYVGFPTVRNLVPPFDESSGEENSTLRVDNSIIVLRGAHVWWELDPSVGMPADFTAYFEDPKFIVTTGSVSSGDLAFTGMELVPPFIGEAIHLNSEPLKARGSEAEMLVHLVMEGSLPDGTPILSNEFVYPIRVCRGCLVNFVSGPDGSKAACTEFESNEDLDIEMPCVVGQDFAVDCRICCQLGSAEDCNRCTGF